MIISTEEKDNIRLQILDYCTRMGGFDKAANSLTNVSRSTLYSINRQEYKNISDEMWRTIRAQVCPQEKKNRINHVETTAVKDLLFCMEVTQENTEFTWAISPAGSGKSVAAEIYKKEHENVFYVLCDEDMKKSDFAQELARAVGLKVNTQKKARTTIMEVINYLYELDNVLIIFDEGDKLSENVFHYFITIYNRLKDMAGILFLSTSFMVKRMESGLRYNKKGYQEIWSRLGSKFYMVSANSPYDVAAICMANGVTEQKHIDTVVQETVKADLNLRRAAKKINTIKRQFKLTA